MDLKTLLPTYFNMGVFRVFVVLVVLFCVYVGYSNDWNFNFAWAECDSRSRFPCELNIDDKLVIIQAGESWGVKPNFWAEKFNFLVFSGLFLAFFVNHMVYYMRTGRFVPEVDKKSWEKVKEVLNP